MAVPQRKRVGDYNPDMETGDVLDSIANIDVEIASVAFDRRKGRNGPYILSVITLADGKVYHTGGGVVAERLAKLFGLSVEELDAMLSQGRSPDAPVNVFPITASFRLEQSQSNPSQKFWTVS
jgi:hypothetical protein